MRPKRKGKAYLGKTDTDTYRDTRDAARLHGVERE